jgi:hypothetical protein
MDTQKLIDELYLCSAQCDTCYQACLEENEDEKEKLMRCMMLDKQCLEICRLTGSLLEENSENTEKFIHLCAEISRQCAEECEKHRHEHCRLCAEECRRCAAMCMEYEHHVTA